MLFKEFVRGTRGVPLPLCVGSLMKKSSWLCSVMLHLPGAFPLSPLGLVGSSLIWEAAMKAPPPPPRHKHVNVEHGGDGEVAAVRGVLSQNKKRRECL